MESPNILVIALLALVVILIALSFHLSLQVRKLEKKYNWFMKGRDGISLDDRFKEKFDEVDQLRAAQKRQRANFAELRQIEQKSFTKYGVVKYDAFEDVGGRLSFALALLNEEDTGVVLNAIHSKDNCFLYLKEIVNGESYIMLSNEEILALRNAKSYDHNNELQELMSTNDESPVKIVEPPAPPEEPVKEEEPPEEEEWLDEEDAEDVFEEEFDDVPWGVGTVEDTEEGEEHHD